MSEESDRRTAGTAPVRVSLVGAGAWARTAHLAALSAREDVVLACVLDADPDRARDTAAEYGFARVAADFDELLAEPADACVIASPASAHASQATALLESGRHVLLEKPMANDAASAWAIVDAASRADREVVLALGWNYSPVFEASRALLDGHPIGQIEHVLLHMASGVHPLLTGASDDSSGRADRPALRSTWTDPAVSGGGYGNAQLSHGLGFLFALLDDGLAEATAVVRPGPYAGIELGLALAGTLRSGATIAVSGTAFRSPTRQHLDLRLYGSEGMLDVDVEGDRARLVASDGAEWSAPLAPGAGAYPGLAPANALIDLIRGLRRRNDSDATVGARTTEVLDVVRAA